MKKLNLMKIFPKEKIFFLQDAIINLDKFYPLKKINFEDHDIINKKIIRHPPIMLIEVFNFIIVKLFILTI